MVSSPTRTSPCDGTKVQSRRRQPEIQQRVGHRADIGVEQEAPHRRRRHLADRIGRQHDDQQHAPRRQAAGEQQGDAEAEQQLEMHRHRHHGDGVEQRPPEIGVAEHAEVVVEADEARRLAEAGGLEAEPEHEDRRNHDDAQHQDVHGRDQRQRPRQPLSQTLPACLHSASRAVLRRGRRLPWPWTAAVFDGGPSGRRGERHAALDGGAIHHPAIAWIVVDRGVQHEGVVPHAERAAAPSAGGSETPAASPWPAGSRSAACSPPPSCP